MCLTIKGNHGIEKTDKDLTVFKLLRVSNDNLTAPYQGTIYKRGKAQSVRRFSCVDYNTTHRFVSRIPKNVDTVDAGLHAFTSLNAARNAKRESWYPNNKVIVQSTIPKGTPFILGTRSEIVSLKLRCDKALGRTSAAKKFNGEK